MDHSTMLVCEVCDTFYCFKCSLSHPEKHGKLLTFIIKNKLPEIK